MCIFVFSLIITTKCDSSPNQLYPVGPYITLKFKPSYSSHMNITLLASTDNHRIGHIFSINTNTLQTDIILNYKKRDPDVDGRMILRWIFRKWEGVVGTGGS